MISRESTTGTFAQLNSVYGVWRSKRGIGSFINMTFRRSRIFHLFAAPELQIGSVLLEAMVLNDQGRNQFRSRRRFDDEILERFGCVAKQSSSEVALPILISIEKTPNNKRLMLAF